MLSEQCLFVISYSFSTLSTYSSVKALGTVPSDGAGVGSGVVVAGGTVGSGVVTGGTVGSGVAGVTVGAVTLGVGVIVGVKVKVGVGVGVGVRMCSVHVICGTVSGVNNSVYLFGHVSKARHPDAGQIATLVRPSVVWKLVYSIPS